MLRPKKQLGGLANRLLSPLSLRLQPLDHDMDRRLISPVHLDAMFGRVAARIETYLRTEAIFSDLRLDFDLEPFVKGFYNTYLPVSRYADGGGSRFLNLLWLAVLARALTPKTIIDSGTFKGLSAWALHYGAPEGEVHSFDLDLSNLELPGHAEYHETDWTSHRSPRDRNAQSLCYFDDHVDQVRRVLEASERGFKYLIFDDDVGVGRLPAIAGSAGPLPKLQFLLDDNLVDGSDLIWTSRGRECRYTIDKPYLDRAQACIAAMHKLPDLWDLVPTVHQNPYTVIALR